MNLPPLELRLRQRIDRLVDERDTARALLALARRRADRAQQVAYAQRRRAELWKLRATRRR
jgi:hypothetical protein